MLSVGAASRPVMLKIESDLADVIEERLHAADPRPRPAAGDRRPHPRFEAEVLARTAFAQPFVCRLRKCRNGRRMGVRLHT